MYLFPHNMQNYLGEGYENIFWTDLELKENNLFSSTNNNQKEKNEIDNNYKC